MTTTIKVDHITDTFKAVSFYINDQYDSSVTIDCETEEETLIAMQNLLDATDKSNKILATLNLFVTEMNTDSFLDSNPGIPEDMLMELALELVKTELL